MKSIWSGGCEVALTACVLLVGPFGAADDAASTVRAAEANPPAEVRDQAKILDILDGDEQALPVEPGAQFFPQSVASGDPRSDSIVLWTRAFDAELPESDLHVRAICVSAKGKPTAVLDEDVIAEAASDHCVKVKVDGLTAGAAYEYFFVYEKGGKAYVSRLGRTKAAPAFDSKAQVTFALVNCQDYVGRYYNAYLALLQTQRKLDFIVHVGDYIYETTGDPELQAPLPGREVSFTDVAGAIQLGTEDEPFLAARSLSNYRELYKTYRSDPVLQQVHESFPMISVWDDHEYSDDAHGATATYFDGRKDESDPVRRRNSERAFFEYMPVDYGLDAEGKLAITDEMLYPNVRLYRDFRFGANVHLVCTDSRSFRPDHLVAEDAFPGAVVMDRPTLEGILTPEVYAALASAFDPYVDANGPLFVPIKPQTTGILAALYASVNPELTAGEAFLQAQAVLKDRISATYLNELFEGAGASPPFDAASMESMDRGLSYLDVGKVGLYDAIGSRYLVGKDSFELLADYFYSISAGSTERVLGLAQEEWLAETLQASTASWKFIASSVSMTPMILDFTNPAIASQLPPEFPSEYRQRFLMNVDQWDGFPNGRASLLDLLSGVPNAVILSGDIHASFVTDHGGGLFEFTGPAISSATIGPELARIISQDPVLGSIEGIEELVGAIDIIIRVSSQDPEVTPSRIVYDETDSNGFVVIKASSSGLKTTYYLIGADEALTSLYDDPKGAKKIAEKVKFSLKDGTLK